MTTPTPPPPGLNPSGLKKWSVYGRHSWLMHRDFVSFDAWQDYKDDQELGFIRSKLLDGVADPEPIDPRFLRNLCRVLQDMQDEIDNKVNRDW
jgi:hypothetical protein